MDIDVLAPAENADCLVLDFASVPARRQHEVQRPRLTSLPSARCLRSGATAELAGWHTPAVGVALAVLVGDRPASPMQADRLAGSIEFVLPALVILDTDSDGPAGLRTVGCILGSAPARWDSVGIRTAGCLLRRNGELVATGAPGVLLGSPLDALAELVETAEVAGRTPQAGRYLLVGSITPTVPAETGDRFDLRVAGLGAVTGRLTAVDADGGGR